MDVYIKVHLKIKIIGKENNLKNLIVGITQEYLTLVEKNPQMKHVTGTLIGLAV